jgi:hypothetical protein
MGRRKAHPMGDGVIVIRDGLEALSKADRNKLRLEGLTVVDSADIDACYEDLEPDSTRWDYYIGLARKGAMYVEVHKVNYDELDKIYAKAKWVRTKIANLGWPEVEGRPLYVCPTAGIELGAAEDIRRRLALKKIIVVMKGDLVSSLLTS